jgi:uncharacterized protein (DUF4213/DUF364 family)
LHVGNDASACCANLVSDLEDLLTAFAHNEISVCDTPFGRQYHAVFTDDADGCRAWKVVFTQSETPVRENPLKRTNKVLELSNLVTPKG